MGKVYFDEKVWQFLLLKQLWWKGADDMKCYKANKWLKQLAGIKHRLYGNGREVTKLSRMIRIYICKGEAEETCMLV